MNTVESKFVAWKASLPKCLGYPGCDGDLPGRNHSEACPMKGKDFATIRDAFIAGFQAACEEVMNR